MNYKIELSKMHVHDHAKLRKILISNSAVGFDTKNLCENYAFQECKCLAPKLLKFPSMLMMFFLFAFLSQSMQS